jgi:SAM-dependent methyltransferase
MARIRRALGILVPLATLAGAVAMGRSIARQRRHPQPFPAARAGVLDNPLARRQAERIVGVLGLAPGMRVLDVGAGIGRLSIPVARRVGESGEVVALDVQQEMLRSLEERAREAGVSNLRTLHAVAGEGTAGKDAFDRALLVAVLGEIPPDRRVPALREIHDALRPGGVLHVVEGVLDPHRQSDRAVARLGTEAGFRPAGTRCIGFAHLTDLVR